MAYCTLQQARHQLATGDTTDNVKLADYLLPATQLIDDHTGYRFEEYVETYGFYGEVGINNAILALADWPLISVTALLNGNGDAISASNYTLLPIGGRYPKEGVRLSQGNYWLGPNDTTSTLTCPSYPPLLDASYAVDAIQITGRWGFHRQYARAWKNTGLTVSGTHTAAVTTLTLSAQAGSAFDVGSVLKVAIANGSIEYLYVNGPISASTTVSDVSAFTTAAPTIDRGWNGSTALAFAGGEAIYVWQPEPVIQWCCAEVVVASYNSRSSASGRSFNPGGFGSVSIGDMPDKVREKLVWPYYSFTRGMGR